MEEAGGATAGLEALRRLKAADAPVFLSPSQELAEAARVASGYLFESLKNYSANCPISELVTDGFDAEQIWAQIETQSEPLMKMVKTHIRKFEKNPEELEKQFNCFSKKVEEEEEKEEFVGGEEEKISEDEDEEVGEGDDEVEDEDDEDEEGEEEEEEEEEEGEEEEGDGLRDVEDKFLKIKELERYLEEDEAREYGIEKEKKRKRRGKVEDEDEDDEDEEEEEEDEEDEDELGLMEIDDLEDDETGNAKYDDFFVGKKKSNQKKTPKRLERSDDSDLDESPNEGSDDSDLDESPKNPKILTVEKKNLSTHEKEQEKLRSQIEDMERANLEPKDWMMQGEVTAGKRSKNSALEVDLDFEHNVRPPPVITEEVTASLEELIQKRILEGRFNDVHKPPTLPTTAPKERMEIDENKNQDGLGKSYEDEYFRKTGLVSTALTYSDEQKKEAETLFKNLCLKLDALSHFHFTPKPVIEDMSIQANVPALAMEEIAPLAVSDAAMLAPEEVFSGKGDIKEQTELTQDERKRRRAKKKRKNKAESVKRMAWKPEQGTTPKDAEGNEAS